MQDDEIRKLKEQIAQTDGHKQKREADDHRYAYDRGTSDDDGEALSRSLERSEVLVRREYNDGAGRLGKRFAVGDRKLIWRIRYLVANSLTLSTVITENQLQAQIITRRWISSLSDLHLP